MIYTKKIKQDEFVLKAPPCKSWHIIVESNLGLKRGDTIELIEVDNYNEPTGKVATGIIEFVTSGDLVINNNDSTFAYTTQIQIIPTMKTVIMTFNLDADGTFNNIKNVYNTTGVSWSLTRLDAGLFQLAPSSDFAFQFKTYSFATPNDGVDGVFFDDTSTSTTTIYSTYQIGGSRQDINMYGGWIRIDFYS